MSNSKSIVDGIPFLKRVSAIEPTPVSAVPLRFDRTFTIRAVEEKTEKDSFSGKVQQKTCLKVDSISDSNPLSLCMIWLDGHWGFKIDDQITVTVEKF